MTLQNPVVLFVSGTVLLLVLLVTYNEFKMNTPTATDKVDSLLNDLEQVETISSSLGTPDLYENEAVQQLIKMGSGIVPLLIERMQEEVSDKRIAFIVLVLHRIGDARALAPLIRLRDRYQQLESRDEWTYAVIGQCNLAIEHLRSKAQ